MPRDACRSNGAVQETLTRLWQWIGGPHALSVLARQQPLQRIPPERPPSLAKDARSAPLRGDQQGPALRRRYERHAAAITALVHCHGRHQTVSILDFSAGGLQLQGAFGVAQGDQIEVELLSGHRLRAKVAWSLGSRIGAQFSPVLVPDSPALAALQRAASPPPSAAAAARAR